MKDLIEANDAAANLVLCHEINLDENFKLPEPNDDKDPAVMTSQGMILMFLLIMLCKCLIQNFQFLMCFLNVINNFQQFL